MTKFFRTQISALKSDIDDEIRRLQDANAGLLESCKAMLGWAKYGEDCDGWYFSEDRAPGFAQDVEDAKDAIAKAEGRAT